MTDTPKIIKSHTAVTLRQIAQESGVSLKTVSRVLNKEGHFHRPQTCARVQEVAQRLGYRPNIAAKAMVTGRFDCIALLLSSQNQRSYLPDRLHNGILDELARRDLHLLTAKLPDEALESEGVVPVILRQLMCDGLLINYTDHIPARMIELIQTHRLPAVWINSRQASDCVYNDDLAAAEKLTALLLARGHRRIAYVDFFRDLADLPAQHYSSTDRLRGYESAMRAAGLAPRLIAGYTCAGPDGRNERVRLAREILRAADPPTAVVGYGIAEVYPLLVAAQALGPGAAPAVGTFADEPIDAMGVRLVTSVLPQAQIGSAAVQMILEKIKQPAVPLPPRPIEAELVPGDLATVA
jgi:LacI family transcriptional regulator